ncbi:MAG: DUF2066 domain-containing protein [Inquilinus sp.]|nr:DUF2066 domain-containing protein [Inquilinus sp.]
MNHRTLGLACLLLLASVVKVPAQVEAPAPETPVEPAAAPAITAPVNPRDELFVVRNVAVDATGDTVSEARETAFADGRLFALTQLLGRMAVDRTQLGEDTLTDEQITGLVEAFEVNSERTTSGRYIGNLTFAFDPAAVRNLLQARLVDFTEVVSKPVLVVPVFRSLQGERLWDSPNPWLDAWLDFFDTERLVPVVVPYGDLADVADISVAAAMTGDRPSLRAIADRYAAGDAIVAIAEPYGGGLTVTLNHYGALGGESSSLLYVPNADTLQTLLAAGVVQATDTLETEWRERNRIQASETNVLAVLVPVTVPSEWFQTQSRLSRVPTITATKIISLSPTEAVMEFQFIGSQSQLQVALAQQNLSLEGEYGTPRLLPTDGARVLP